jgi:4-amino-4-deoxy-L-arabinose transferase-like glycosyltransferase
MLLFVLSVCVALPGLFALPSVDRDESRFAQASRQMLESGDWVVPRVQDRPRLNKPPLIYWLQASSAKVLGDPADGNAFGNIWVYRVPSVLCMTLTVLLTWRLGLKMMDARAAVLGAALLGVSPMLVWDAHQARADQLLVLTVVAAQLCLFNVFRIANGADRSRRSWVWAVGLWVCVGLGVLAKGPVTPLIVVLTMLGIGVLTGKWAWILRTHFLGGIMIVGAMIGPWVWMVATRVGWETYWRVIVDETIGRSREAAEGHWGPPGYHLVLLCVLFWPGVLLTSAAVAQAWRRGREHIDHDRQGVLSRVRLAIRGRGADVFLLAWILPSWVMFEAISTKLPHYTLVIYPAIALLSARAVYSATAGTLAGINALGAKVGFAIWGAVGAIVPAGVMIGLVWLQQDQPVSRFVLVCAVIGGSATMAGTTFGLWLMSCRLFAHAMWTTVVAMLVWSACLLQVVLPQTRQVWIGPRLIEAIREHERDYRAPSLGANARAAAVALVGYHEDSMVFLTRGAAERVDAERLEVWLKQHRNAYICVQRPTAKRPTIAPSAAEAPDTLDIVGEVSGLNYSTGERVTIDVYYKGSR